MKKLALITILLIPFFGWNQVKFTAKTLDNGFRYPVMIYTDDMAVQDSINAIIVREIDDLKASDFCIGDYGYVQKGNHIEMHLVCNCIEMSDADHRYLFFNLVNGTKVNHSDIFDDKKKNTALKIITHKVKKGKDTNSCAAEFGEFEGDLDFSKMNIRLFRDGLEIRPIDSDCLKNPVKVMWTELSSCLKYNFI